MQLVELAVAAPHQLILQFKMVVNHQAQTLY
jgi:hypothetical protein